MKILALAVIASGALLAACGERTKTVGREFHTMAECMAFVNTQVGPLKVITDTPRDISGRQVEGNRFFRCEKKVTGTRGILVEGRWDVPAK